MEVTSSTSKTPAPLKSVGGDTWELELGEISAPLAVTPLLDGKPAKGPAYKVRPGQTLDIFPRFVATKGTVSEKWPSFESKALADTTRSIRVYLPPTYEENTTARFPVLYMHDGQTLFGNLSGQLVFIGGDTKVDDTMDKGADTGEIAEAIVIGIDSPVTGVSQTARVAELTPTNNETDSKGSGKGPQYLAMVVSEIKPMVDRELRTRPERDSTFMGGASIGALFSDWVGLTHGDVFAGVFGLSSSAWWDGEMIVPVAKGSKAGPRADRVYVDVGDGEDDAKMIETNKHLFKAYTDAGYAEGTMLRSGVIKGGKHTAGSFSERLPAALAHVLGPGR
jgi:predicted alpha/beta superfamily hydrolase